ncbi:hypothetical protein GQ600_3657 [Phytophthora cactorum]|nr:hypothetical protein GQ600_3657 [Phytophthora cactorum]
MRRAIDANGKLTWLCTADVAAAVSSGTGNEPWVIVQGVQSVLETVHRLRGCPGGPHCWYESGDNWCWRW